MVAAVDALTSCAETGVALDVAANQSSSGWSGSVHAGTSMDAISAPRARARRRHHAISVERLRPWSRRSNAIARVEDLRRGAPSTRSWAIGSAPSAARRGVAARGAEVGARGQGPRVAARRCPRTGSVRSGCGLPLVSPSMCFQYKPNVSTQQNKCYAVPIECFSVTLQV